MVQKRMWVVSAAWFCLLLGMGKMTAKAEPALLVSETAAIYENMDEESSAVGNLVQGSSFELLGSATADDGSMWYHVSAYGVAGYVRGDMEIERGGGEQTLPEEETPDETQQALPENMPTAEDVQEDETESTESASEGDAFVYQGNNVREKTYAVTAVSIKSTDAGMKEDYSEARQENEKNGGEKGISRNMMFFLLVLTGSALAALVSYKKIRKELQGEKGRGKDEFESKKSARSRRAVHRRRKHRKKKGKSRRQSGDAKKQ